ncbi:MAG: DUF2213 domain-containing protein [Pseudomonadota bacterium]
MPTIRLAFDRSARRIDADGRLHVERSHISKANICSYYGREIPGYEALGLNPEQIYKLFRDPVELERAAPTFARLPILSEHVPVTVDAPRADLVVGAIGSDVAFVAPYLDADLSFWDAAAIAGIETDQVRELSCAYRYVPVMEPGEYEGDAYDGRMTQIQGNHLALVEVGRAGADVIVADHNPFPTFKEHAMKMTKLGAALFAAFSAASPVLAADSALPALVGQAAKTTFDKAGVKSKLLALDATLSPQQLDNVIDALLDVEQEPKAAEPPKPAEDQSPADKLRALLAGKVDDSLIDEACAMMGMPAADEFPDKDGKDDKDEKDKGMKEKDVKAAMDSFGADLRKQLGEASEAARDVRGVVGDVIGMDSAADVYGFALDHMKIERKGVEGTAALRALFKVASAAAGKPSPTVAQDAGGMATRFPNAARFGRA